MKRTALLSRRVLAVALAITLALGAAPAWAVPLPAGTTRVSVNSSGVPGNGDSWSVAISADGRYATFVSLITTLVAGDTNAAPDIFVKDRATSATTRVSVSSANVQGNGQSLGPCISSDGRYVAFSSEASNLVAGDTNGELDVFVKDRVTGATTRVSVDSVGLQATGASGGASISSDGRFVAFESSAPNLVAGDTNGAYDVFVKDRVSGGTTRVSVDSFGTQGNSYSGLGSAMSSDGRYVTFTSYATNLVTGDTNTAGDVFVRDRVAGTTTRLSVNSSGVQANGSSISPTISSDGRYVAFVSEATNLVTGDTNAAGDVFVRDRVAGTTTRVSVGPSGVQANGASQFSSISADGHCVAFSSVASNLVAGDTNAVGDVFVRVPAAGVTTRVSVDSAGVQGNGESLSSSRSSISSDGHVVAFDSHASNLVPNDTNAKGDAFVRDGPTPTSITIKTTATTTYIGKSPSLSGAVTPDSMIGVNIVAYVMKAGKSYWSYSSNRTVYNLNGAPAWWYRYYFKPGMARGYYKFKARAPAPGFASSAGFATSESPIIIIRVK